MISVVILFGVLKENLKRGFRILSLDFYDALQDKNFISTIPITYWTREENNRIISSKSGSDHGFGIYNIKNAVYRNGGEFNYSVKEEEFFKFEFEIMLPLN